MRRTSLALSLVCLLLFSHSVALALNPTQDTDGDSIPDMEEDANGNGTMDEGETNPYDADSDNGGEADGSEKTAKRNPLDQTDDMTFDADGDGWVNGLELLNGTDSKNPDSDGDGIPDSLDPFPLQAQFHEDQNTNGLPDEWERKTGLDQLQVTQTKADDSDGDGLTNAEELARETNPLKIDTDNDGTDDRTEIEEGGNPKENACLEYAQTERSFEDIEDHWSVSYVQSLLGLAIRPENRVIIRGYEEPTPHFAPDQPVTRYEFTKMVILSTCIKLATTTENEKTQFNDVLSKSTLNERDDVAEKRRVIYTAARHKIVAGYDDGTFRSDAEINRAEAVKILIGAVGFSNEDGSGSTATIFTDVQSTDWFAPYVNIASSREIVKGYEADNTFRPQNSITRAEAAAIIERTIRQNPTVNGYVLP